MAHDLVIIRLKGGAVDYNLELGFIPNFVRVTVMSGTNPDTYRWYGEPMEDSAEALAGSWEYGIKNTAGGAETYMATAATGISAYDGAKTPRVLIESPKPGIGLVEAAVADWLAATSYSTGERSATAVGTIVRPPTHNGYVYELTTDTGSGTSEPTAGWTTTPGETSTDGGSNVWTCRQENVVAPKGKGITLGGSLLETDKIVYVEAYRNCQYRDIGDIG